VASEKEKGGGKVLDLKVRSGILGSLSRDLAIVHISHLAFAAEIPATVAMKMCVYTQLLRWSMVILKCVVMVTFREKLGH
jgi:hypothetical protein